MDYRLYQKRNDMFSMFKCSSCNKITYYSKQKMKEIYPDGGYEVIGEIGNFAEKYTKQDIIITDTGRTIPIFPRGSLKKPFEWITGYAAVGENTYVSVVKSIIPRWMKNFYVKKV